MARKVVGVGSVGTRAWVILLLGRDASDRLHYAAAGTAIGPFCIGGAVLIREWITTAGIETIVTVLVLFLANPVLVIATARAARRIEVGTLEPQPAEKERGG
jgi:multisubunit Na+/H+ antiporter MnhG subunit